MEIKNSGEMIKAYRKVRAMTQAELAEEICSVKEIRRIEKGDATPNLSTYEKIITKLGINPANHILAFTNENDMKVYIMIQEIEEQVFDRKYELAEEKFKFFLSQSYYNKDDIFQKQFACMIETILLLEINKDPGAALIKATEAIEVTFPNFVLAYLDKRQLSHLEYRILNLTALIYNRLNEVDKCIDILTRIKTSLNKRTYLKYIKNRLLPTICYNLSKYLGQQEKDDEVISICNEGIEICIENKTFKNLGELLYNKARSLHYKNNLIEAKKCFQDSLYVFRISGNIEMAKTIQENAKTKFDILLDD